jgi:translocation and assembly module TamA
VVFSTPLIPKIDYQVKGVKSPILSHLNIRLKEIKKQLSLAPEFQLQNWHSQSKEAIQDTLHAFGYFKAQFKVATHKTQHGYQVTYHIDLGPLLRMTTLDIQLIGPGKENKTLQDTIAHLLSNQGQGMTTERYQKIKRTLYKAAISEGYLDANWSLHTVSVDLSHYTATIRLSLNTGNCYKIGKIHFTSSPLSQAFLKRYLTFKEGDPYRLNDILNLQTSLKNTGYFQQAFVQTQNTEDTKKIPLVVSLTPAPKYYYTLGGGFSSDAGIRFKSEGLIRRVTSTGHQVAGILQLSPNQISALGVYTIPGNIPSIQQNHIQIEIAQYYLNKIKTETQSLGFLSTYQYLDYKLTYFIHWHREIFKEPIQDTPHHVYLFMPGLVINKIKADWSKTHHHYKMHYQAQAAFKPFLSNINFFKTEFDGNYFGALNRWNSESYLVLRLRMGHILSSQASKIPPSLSFYAGGYRYPRGHEEYKLGKSILASSTEYRQHLIGLLYCTPFADMSYDVHEPTSLKMSTGIGLCLWYPSIGNVEISYVKTFDHTGKHSPWKWIGRISTDL